MMVLAILACAACYGDPHSAQTHGMNWAIWFMLGLTGVVLSGLSAVFYGFARRARRLELDKAIAGDGESHYVA